MSLIKVKSWFANKRNRTHLTKPKVATRAVEEQLAEVVTELSRRGGGGSTDSGSCGSLVDNEASAASPDSSASTSPRVLAKLATVMAALQSLHYKD